MARSYVFPVATKLYHPSEGERLFPAGETDPGGMWTERPGGETVGAATTTQALKDLIAAQELNEQLEARLVAAARDMAEAAQAKSDALAKVAGLEQRAVAAEKAKADAEDLAVQYMRERDDARAELAKLKAKPAKADA